MPPEMTPNDHDAVVRMEGTLGRLSEDVRRLADGLEKQLLDHENRLKVLEGWRHDFALTWKIVLGVASIVGAVTGLAIQAAIAYFSRGH